MDEVGTSYGTQTDAKIVKHREKRSCTAHIHAPNNTPMAGETVRQSEWDIFIGCGHWRDRKSQPESFGSLFFSLSSLLRLGSASMSVCVSSVCVCVGPFLSVFVCLCVCVWPTHRRLVYSFVSFSCHLRWSPSFRANETSQTKNNIERKGKRN